MQIDKNNRMNSLFEFYGALLTDKQHSYLELYYGDDYSLGEIATEFDVSRQAVYDNIRRTEASLEEYEAKLHLLANYQAQNQAVDALVLYVHQHYAEDAKLSTLLTRVADQAAR
ncbi:putative DNA-binding protein [Lacticaseibacillus parakribbianus]|uniref:putative DNA-binding protein n=1 Tax=Lacticaseibacillus parakribbianus TaxID=2970927 RepID=UPI0021CB3BC9|nr:putative DNA-binding protein [Lacticaseibacillus parakribbianus]